MFGELRVLLFGLKAVPLRGGYTVVTRALRFRNRLIPTARRHGDGEFAILNQSVEPNSAGTPQLFAGINVLLERDFILLQQLRLNLDICAQLLVARDESGELNLQAGDLRSQICIGRVDLLGHHTLVEKLFTIGSCHFAVGKRLPRRFIRDRFPDHQAGRSVGLPRLG